MSNGINFRKLAVDLRQELTACQKERDEGLAREAELSEWVDEVMAVNAQRGQRNARLQAKCGELQQRLAEAEKITPEMIEVLIAMWPRGYRNEQTAIGCWQALMKARPGCTDGEKSE